MSSDVRSITPNLSSFLKSLQHHDTSSSIDHLVLLLRRKLITGSRACALATAHIYQTIITESTLSTASKLLNHVRATARRLQAASPHELVISNIARRVLGLIREAYEAPASDETEPTIKPSKRSTNPSSDLFSGLDGSISTLTTDAPLGTIREDVLEGLGLLLDELRASDSQVADSALDHIHAAEILLTYGSSLTVQKFLLAAAKKRKFTVIVVEGYPNQHRATHETAMHGLSVYDDEEARNVRLPKTLSAAGVSVILVPESAVFALMSQVSKVLLPIQVGFPNGGFVGAAGCSMIAQAAQEHRVPVVALGAVYKLSPEHPYDPEGLEEVGDSMAIAGYDDDAFPEGVEVLNPVTEYVSPELVDLWVTNIGGHAPSFLYRIIADHYRAEDTELDP